MYIQPIICAYILMFVPLVRLYKLLNWFILNTDKQACLTEYILHMYTTDYESMCCFEGISLLYMICVYFAINMVIVNIRRSVSYQRDSYSSDEPCAAGLFLFAFFLNVIKIIVFNSKKWNINALKFNVLVYSSGVFLLIFCLST